MSNDFRVRFAPSPTGMLHIGNARTAALNWLLARSHGGSFILRIEDTDIERSSAESESSILEDVRWLGLDWDEGPDIGGGFGPYRQSERSQLYIDTAKKLIDDGKAYYCHASDEDMEKYREDALARGEAPLYRGQFSGDNVEVCPDGTPGSIRFRVPDEVNRWKDLAKGEVAIEGSTVSDFIILRADGRPTYNFACVVDDMLMKISHVVRGDDHLSNTPRQLMVYRALGADIPQFAHIPMILGSDHKRLSKRHGATSVGEFKQQGYLPQALINYLSLLSWSSESGDDFLSLDRLKEEIDFDRLGKSAAVFDTGKLRWLNGKHIRELDEDKLVSLAREYSDGMDSGFDDDSFREAVLACRGNLELLPDIQTLLPLFTGKSPAEITEPESLSLVGSEEASKTIPVLAGYLEGESSIDAAGVKDLIKKSGKECGVKGKMLFMPIRLALTGQMHGPELPRLIAVIGPQRCAELLNEALVKYGTKN